MSTKLNIESIIDGSIEKGKLADDIQESLGKADGAVQVGTSSDTTSSQTYYGLKAYADSRYNLLNSSKANKGDVMQSDMAIMISNNPSFVKNNPIWVGIGTLALSSNNSNRPAIFTRNVHGQRLYFYTNEEQIDNSIVSLAYKVYNSQTESPQTVFIKNSAGVSVIRIQYVAPTTISIESTVSATLQIFQAKELPLENIPTQVQQADFNVENPSAVGYIANLPFGTKSLAKITELKTYEFSNSIDFVAIKTYDKTSGSEIRGAIALQLNDMYELEFVDVAGFSGKIKFTLSNDSVHTTLTVESVSGDTGAYNGWLEYVDIYALVNVSLGGEYISDSISRVGSEEDTQDKNTIYGVKAYVRDNKADWDNKNPSSAGYIANKPFGTVAVKMNYDELNQPTQSNDNVVEKISSTGNYLLKYPYNDNQGVIKILISSKDGKDILYESVLLIGGSLEVSAPNGYSGKVIFSLTSGGNLNVRGYNETYNGWLGEFDVYALSIVDIIPISYIPNSIARVGTTSDTKDKDTIYGVKAYIDDKISANTEAINAVASTSSAKYNKPSGGIPTTDLDTNIRLSLEKADSAVQHEDLNYYLLPFTIEDIESSESKHITFKSTDGDYISMRNAIEKNSPISINLNGDSTTAYYHVTYKFTLLNNAFSGYMTCNINNIYYLIGVGVTGTGSSISISIVNKHTIEDDLIYKLEFNFANLFLIGTSECNIRGLIDAIKNNKIIKLYDGVNNFGIPVSASVKETDLEYIVKFNYFDYQNEFISYSHSYNNKPGENINILYKTSFTDGFNVVPYVADFTISNLEYCGDYFSTSAFAIDIASLYNAIIQKRDIRVQNESGYGKGYNIMTNCNIVEESSNVYIIDCEIPTATGSWKLSGLRYDKTDDSQLCSLTSSTVKFYPSTPYVLDFTTEDLFELVASNIDAIEYDSYKLAKSIIDGRNIIFNDTVTGSNAMCSVGGFVNNNAIFLALYTANIIYVLQNLSIEPSIDETTGNINPTTITRNKVSLINLPQLYNQTQYIKTFSYGVNQIVGSDSLVYALPGTANGDEDVKLLGDTTVKTINNTKIYRISSTDATNIYTYYPLIYTTRTSTTINPNHLYQFGRPGVPVSGNLDIKLGAEISSAVVNEYIFEIYIKDTVPTLSLSLSDGTSDIKWVSGDAPVLEENKIYQISIINKLGTVLSWDNV